MNCAELEVLICDYVDGALDAAHKAEVESHLADCALCAELMRDASAAVPFQADPALALKSLFFANSIARASTSRFSQRPEDPVLAPRGLETLPTLTYLSPKCLIPQRQIASDQNRSTC